VVKSLWAGETVVNSSACIRVHPPGSYRSAVWALLCSPGVRCTVAECERWLGREYDATCRVECRAPNICNSAQPFASGRSLGAPAELDFSYQNNEHGLFRCSDTTRQRTRRSDNWPDERASYQLPGSTIRVVTPSFAILMSDSDVHKQHEYIRTLGGAWLSRQDSSWPASRVALVRSRSCLPEIELCRRP
jgi:hypothetical protein